MKRINIICVSENLNKLNQLIEDLRFFSQGFNIEICQSALECMALLEDIEVESKLVALVIADQFMLGKTGMELLSDIETDNRFLGTKKLLLAGSSNLVDIINAMGQSKLDHFLEGDYQTRELVKTAQELISQYTIENDLEIDGYSDTLDNKTLSRFPLYS